MPLYPEVEPKSSDFPQQPSLSSLPDDQLVGGVAPWRNSASTTKDFATDASPLVFGCGVFGQGMYNDPSHVASSVPIRTVRLALRYGLNTFDTSPYYFPSEFIIGNILRALKPEHPRSSYFLMTKCGRYGPDKEHFDYSKERVEKSIRGSCERLGTDYLDVGLMHDVEFVADGPGKESGWESGIVSGFVPGNKQEALEKLGLSPSAASIVHGKGDKKVLEAIRTLFALKDQGVIKRVGISGYPLPVLLRISRMVATNAPFRPLDVILSYSNHCLYSDVLVGWKELFAANPGVEGWTPPILLNGSPFSMGLLTDGEPPEWHPASEQLKTACQDASTLLRERGSSLAQTALTFGLRGSELGKQGPELRTLVGLSTPDQVHSLMHAYRVLSSSGDDDVLYPQAGEDTEQAYKEHVENEMAVRDLFRQRNVSEWSWSSGL